MNKDSNTCPQCQEPVSDGAHCVTCNRDLHFHCVGFKEHGWRKLGVERQATWRCQKCKQAGQLPPSATSRQPSPAPEAAQSTPEVSEPSTTVLLAEIRSLAAKLAPLESLTQEVKALREDFAGLQETVKVANDSMKEFAVKVKKVEDRLSQLENAKKDQMNLIQSRLDKIEEDIHDKEQWSRMNNVEIKGVKQLKNENLFDIITTIGSKVNYPIQKTLINFVTRVPTRDPEHTKPIIVCFNNRYAKDDFVAAARMAMKESPLTTSALGFGGNTNVFVNDHLTTNNKALLSKAKKMKIERGFQYLWVRHCKIFMRKNDTSPVVRIKTEKDLGKLGKYAD